MRTASILSAFVLLSGSAVHAFPPSIMSIGPGQAVGVSPDGTRAVVTFSPIGDHLWTSGIGNTPIPISPTDVSNNGVVVGGASGRPYRWSVADGAVDLGGLPGNPGGNGRALDISADGSDIVGWSDNGIRDEAFRWKASTGLVGLGTLPNSRTRAEGISADGSTIYGTGFRQTPGITTPFFSWTEAAGMVEIGTLVQGGGIGQVSADGSYFAGYHSPSFGGPDSLAIRWGNGVFQNLGAIPNFGERYYRPTCVSPDGSIVIGGASGGTDLGIYWDSAHGIRSLRNALTNDYGLDLSGWAGLYPLDCSADAQTVVGWGLTTGGSEMEAFVLRLPEPATLALLGFGIGLLRRRRG